MPAVAVVILTYNEGLHLSRAIQSVKPFARSIHVIDSFSTDGTLNIAKWHDAEILQHPFKHQADQFEWGLANIATDADWILRLDADEIIEPDLADSIQSSLNAAPDDVVGATFDRKHIFLGRWIKHGGRYPLRLLRLFRRGHGRTEQRWMDEHIFVEGGRTIHINGGFADHNLNDLEYFTAKHNKYATREAIAALNEEIGFLSSNETDGHTSRQATVKKWMKRNVFSRMPYPFSSALYFTYRYVVQFGFLDGREGTVYHFLQGFWYRFLVGARKQELRSAIKHLKAPVEIRAELARLTGLDLN